MIEKKNVLKILKLPKEVKFCRKCTISNQRPRISFDKEVPVLHVISLRLRIKQIG